MVTSAFGVFGEFSTALLGEIVYVSKFEGQVRLKAIFTPEGNVKEVAEAVKQASTHD